MVVGLVPAAVELSHVPNAKLPHVPVGVPKDAKTILLMSAPLGHVMVAVCPSGTVWQMSDATLG